MPPADAASLALAVADRRRELGWTQEELARRVVAAGDPAFRQSDVSRLEKGRVGLPRRERLERIARVLGLPAGELLARSGWAGTERVLPEPERVPTAAGDPPGTEDRPGPAVWAGRPVPRWAAAGGSELLRQRIARARETGERSAEVLRRSREAYDRANRAFAPFWSAGPDGPGNPGAEGA